MAGYTSSKDGCQSIITDLARDILHQREHRLQRRRELHHSAKVEAGLANKQQYMKDQLDQYKQYVNKCLSSLNKAGTSKRVHFATLEDNNSKENKLRSRSALKYPATKLHDKGILQTIEGLPNSHLKNVQFVFLPLEQVIHHSRPLKCLYISFYLRMVCSKFLLDLWESTWKRW